MDERGLWASLWALVVGFFMILLDTTIVSVANPAIMRGLGLGDDYAGVIWVTSAYLLAYAVPLLVTGRLGDRFGPRRVYLAGLVVFTVSSAWCGLSGVLPGGGLAMLVVARAVQGLGASLMSPQTMAIITRTFPPARRGAAMGVWGAVAGVAALVGPILGGVLVDTLGWEWIFIVNVPVGLAAFYVAWRFVPRLERHAHRFDLPGVALFVAGMLLLVFGLQEGNTYRWGTIVGPVTVLGLIGAGVALLALFVGWQAVQSGEPLLPLALLRDRNFSLANTAIAAVGLSVTAMVLPLVFYLQTVRGLTPTQGALLLSPSAILSIVLARRVGRLVDRVHNPRVLTVPGLVALAAGIAGYGALMNPTTDVRLYLAAACLVGVGGSFVWGPISTTANRSLPPQWAGAGSGVFNTTRQLGSVLGSAAIAALMEHRIAARLPGQAAGAQGAVLPEQVRAPFAAAMAESMLLPVGVLVVAIVTTAFFVPPPHRRPSAGPPVP
nr:DHA2 family efflux MFS transporter permease subunit [Propionibacterium sp.]